MRILLYAVSKPTALTLAPEGGRVLLNGTPLKAPVLISAKGPLVAVKGFGPAVKAARVEMPGKGAWLSGGPSPKRLYKGLLEITSEKGRLKAVNTLPLEEYIASVVSAEAGDLSQAEAFKAQAVAARTYSLKSMNNHIKDGCNMCDSTHCQFFSGFAEVRPAARAAAEITRGEVLNYRGRPAETFYHSICGGRTEDMSRVWPFERQPYLVPVADGPENRPYCSIAPGFKWKTRISLKTLTKIARAQKWLLPDENIIKVAATDRGTSKRALTIEFTAERRRVRISATNFYHAVGRRAGWNAVRSTLFSLYSGKDFAVFEGRGYGHGVGMCQWGAEGMARQGFKYRDILGHYYPGTENSHD